MSAGSSGYSSTLFSVFKRAQITRPERYLLRPFFGVPSRVENSSLLMLGSVPAVRRDSRGSGVAGSFSTCVLVSNFLGRQDRVPHSKPPRCLCWVLCQQFDAIAE